MAAHTRSLLAVPLALVSAGAVAVAPAATAPPAPVGVAGVHVADIQLAGWFTDTVLYWGDVAATAAIAAVAPIPLIGPPLATQIDINWYDGLRPLAAVTSAYITSVVVDPLGFFVHTGNYVSNVGFIGYNYVAAQLASIGIWVPPIPPPPPVAAVNPGRLERGRVAPTEALSARTPAAEAAAQATVEVADEATPVARPSRIDARPARQSRSALALPAAAAGRGDAGVRTVDPQRDEVRSGTRSARGAASRGTDAHK